MNGDRPNYEVPKGINVNINLTTLGVLALVAFIIYTFFG